MVEVIGFSLVGFMVLGIIIGIRKLFGRKKKLFDEEEIILDSKMMHFGPFSGSFMYTHRKFIFLLACSSSFLEASLELRTIDNWGIWSYSNENLVLQKTSEDKETNLYIEMSRPFCICTDPTILIPVGDTNYSEGDRVKATMTVDKGKPKEVILKVYNILGSGSDRDYVMKLHYFPSMRDVDMINIKFNSATPFSNIAFNTKGMANAMHQSEKICMSGYDIEETEMLETNLI
jgi:hypothetical protein